MNKEKAIPRTLAMNFRGDIRDIATLVSIYEDRLGFRIPSKSAIIRLALSDYVSVLSSSLKEKKFESTTEAYRFLRQRHLISLEDSKVGLMKEIIKENVVIEEDELQAEPRVISPEVERMMKDPKTVKRAEELSKKGGD